MCNFSGMIKNVLPSLRQRAGPQRICSRQKSIRSGTARNSFSQTPHMRGKGGGASHIVAVLGITPAHAGKSGQQPSARPCRRDHPRVCGEKPTAPLHPGRNEGSPPRMRGKVFQTLAVFFPVGITPAYAGKRLKRSRSTVPHAAIVPLFPSVCNKPAGSDGSPAGHDAPPFLPIENAAPASPAYNLRSL